MPFNVARSAQFPDKEILKFPAGLDAIKSAVLDANFVTVVGDTRNVVPAGTIMKLSATNAHQVVPYAGTGTIVGILARPVDVATAATAGAEPLPLFFHQCVFATTQIVGFTQYASALVSTLKTCLFE